MLDVRGLRRIAAAQLTIDESTAVAVAQPELRARRLGFWATGLSVFVFWNLSTLAGALIGDALGDPQRYGLDAAADTAGPPSPPLASRTPDDAMDDGAARQHRSRPARVRPGGLTPDRPCWPDDLGRHANSAGYSPTCPSMSSRTMSR